MGLRERNLSELRRIAGPLRGRRAVDAVRAGLAILEAGMIRRCPVLRGGLVRSIHQTAVKSGPRSIGGAVVVGTDHALAVEYGPHARPFVRPTRAVDGPRAERAMIETFGRD